MKKCLVLDLDNTLWGGIVAEDGIENLALSLTPPGNSFVAFQQAILDLHDRGVILAVNSRNNLEDAMDVIRKHPNMILKEQHFAAFRINWNDKAENMRELAKELNIGLDSMVFLDDDRTNRDLVKALLSEVLVPDLPTDPSEYVRFLASLNVFDAKVITDEDKMRGNLYVTERLRKEEEKRFATKEDFLKSLGLELTIYIDDNSCIPRLSQLTEKTNQFNTNKKPLTEAEVGWYIESPKHHLFYGKLQDKFGDYGVVVLGIVEKKEASWHLLSFLMSCRVFGREVEEAFFGTLCGKALLEEVKNLTISFTETPKNVPAKTFVEKYFNNGEYNIPDKPYIPEWIKVIIK